MAINVEVFARRNEDAATLIKRFSRKVRKEEIMEEFRERMYYEKPSDKRRRLRKKRRAQTKKIN
jgi:ribosomal protein S21